MTYIKYLWSMSWVRFALVALFATHVFAYLIGRWSVSRRAVNVHYHEQLGRGSRVSHSSHALVSPDERMMKFLRGVLIACILFALVVYGWSVDRVATEGCAR